MDETEDIYVKFRYNFRDSELGEANAMPKIVELLGVINMDQRSHQERVKFMTMGVERLDKYGEDHRKHIHIHMLINDKVASLRKRLQRFFASEEETRKGNCLYALSCEEDVIDADRFFRYVFKQWYIENSPLENSYMKNYWKLPPGFDFFFQSKLAYDEWQRDVAFNKKKKDLDNRPSTKDKLFAYLDGLDSTILSSRKMILIEILKYYDTNEMSANQSTIMGYLNTALLRYKIISYEQMAELWLK